MVSKIKTVTPINIVIEHSNTKRRILGVFRLMGSRDDFLLLRDIIDEKIGKDYVYGSISITKCTQNHIVNTEPLPWD